MKKIILLGLFAVITVFTLVACGGSGSSVSEDDLIGRWEHGSGTLRPRDTGSAWVLSQNVLVIEENTMHSYGADGEISDINIVIWRLDDGNLVVAGTEFTVEIIDNVLSISAEVDGETTTREWLRVE